MPKLRSIFPLSMFLLMAAAPFANAASGPDLSPAISPPALTDVGATGRYYVNVANTGNQNANNASLTIALPATHTSPQVYVMGTLGAKSANCSLAGTTLTCNLGTIRRRASASVYFDIALPQSAAPLTIVATSSVSGDSDGGNNSATHNASVRYRNVPAGPGGMATNRHCTGTSLTAFFECTKFPSSISSHNAEFLGTGTSGTITIPGQPAYTGSWTLSGPSNSHLVFQYFELGTLAATFVGDGVSANCYEGLTTFNPPSAYVAPYQVCF